MQAKRYRYEAEVSFLLLDEDTGEPTKSPFCEPVVVYGYDEDDAAIAAMHATEELYPTATCIEVGSVRVLGEAPVEEALD